MKLKVNLLLEGESAVFIRVEELDEAMALALAGAKVAVVLQVVQELEGVNEAVGVAVNTLECRVRCKVTNGAESLASGLKGALTLTDGDEQVLQSVLRFKA